MLIKALSLTLILIISTSHINAQECSTPFDFTQWSVEGAPNSEWDILSSTDVINLSYITPATFFVSDFELINVIVRGTMSVETTADDDFTGFIFGYQEPTQIADDNNYEFYLFDWKSKRGSLLGFWAEEGFRLSHYNGYIPANKQDRYFYGALDNPPIRDLIQTKYGSGRGWVPYQKYEIELIYTNNRIKLSIDGVMIFELNGCFAAGKIGFHCMSQEKTRFENFTYESHIEFTTELVSACTDEDITFYPYDPACSVFPVFIDSLSWNFGDGTTSSEIIPTHSYSTAGDYTVSMLVTKNDDCVDTVSYDVLIKPDPIVDLGNDTLVMACSSLSLDAENEGSSYLWSTGEISQTINLDKIYEDTIIWVEVNSNSCVSSDTIIITTELSQEELFFPNAFTPNMDGINDSFGPIGIVDNVSQYQLDIYNRWGQLVFQTNDPSNSWNGEYSGEPSPYGVYVYTISYQFDSFCNGPNNFSSKSTLSLVR